MNKKDKQLRSDIEGIANLVAYAEQYPQGATKIGYHYYNASALIDALKDIRTRAALGASTKADHLLMEILAGLI